MFLDDAFSHVLHMVTLLGVKLAGKHSNMNLYMIAEVVMRAFACCRLGRAVGSTAIHASGILWAPVCCMDVTDTAPTLPGLVWPRLVSGCPGGQARKAWAGLIQ